MIVILEDQLSEAAARALQHARQFAVARKAETTDLLDLFAGLLNDNESQAVAILVQSGGDPADLRRHFRIPDQPTEAGADDFPLGNEVREVVAQAAEYSLQVSRYEQIGSEELLTALLSVWEGVDCQFEACGIDRKAIVADFRRRRSPQPIDVPTDEPELIPADPLDGVDMARMTDANANRAREALRVLEDYARFVLDDAELCERLKTCRHSLREALSYLPPRWLLESRQTDSDVGTWISTREEFARTNLADILAANCKRAQEAIRTLEECAKVENANAARILEQIRYRLYSIEKRLIPSGKGGLTDAALYWLVDPEACVGEIEWMLEQAISGGVQVVQLRDKTSSDRELLELAHRFRRVTSELGALFIVNDRPDIARLVRADGVHLGQDDLTIRDARRILGPDAVVGVSTHDLQQARQAVDDGADYIGVGPIFPSKTKSFDDFAGLDFVRQVARNVRIPAFCIGGIDRDNVDKVIEAGGARIVVGHALTSEKEPLPIARTLRSLLDESFGAGLAD